MKINREQFLNDLNAVKAGLSPREFIEQSSCLVFQSGMVMTFNDEVACKKKIEGLEINGAIQAQNLFAILEKMDDQELEVLENDKGELEFQGKRKRFGVTKDAEIFLPIDRVDVPEKWHSLPKEFIEAVHQVQHCVSTDESRFLLTCVHISPEFIEACDNLQIMRCQVQTGLKRSVLVRGSSLVHITTLGMDKVALTESWIHFKNQQGLIYSCRRYNEEYPKLDHLLDFKGHPIVIPKGLVEASDRAAIFASDRAGDPYATVTIRDDRIKIRGEGVTGWYEEKKKTSYDGPPMLFVIAPELLKWISQKYDEAQLKDDKLKVAGDDKGMTWQYVTVLGRPQDKEEEEQEEKPKKKVAKEEVED